MKSYASIDRIEGNFFVCEVELVSVQESQNMSALRKETVMLDLELSALPEEIGTIFEGDIIVVEHDTKNISHVYGKDNEEKQRRIKLLKNLIGF